LLAGYQGRVENPKALDVDNCIGGCFLYRRQVYEAVGDFHEEAFLAEDYEYWLRVREKFRMKKLDQALYYYRTHEESLTGKHKEPKVQMQVESIRDRFIRAWKKHYLRAKKNYCSGDLEEAKREVFRSLRGNPWYVPGWRLAALLCLDRGFVAWVRRAKRFLSFRKL
jgi:GT2 family glycosyltransferase